VPPRPALAKEHGLAKTAIEASLGIEQRNANHSFTPARDHHQQVGIFHHHAQIRWSRAIVRRVQ
jgi:hypothetical protein